MPIIPTRNGILKEIARLNIPEIAAPEAFKLYKCIEFDFDPLHIAVNVQEMLLVIEQLGEKLGHSEYGQYSNSIKKTVAAKIVKQISSIYESIKFARLSEIIPFYNRMQLEQFLVDICKQNLVSAHIDHRQNCIYFGHVDSLLASELESEHGRISEISKITTHVSLVYSILQDAYLDIDQSLVKELQEKLARQIKIYLTHKDGDFERVLARRKRIELYKENTEQMKKEKLFQSQMLANKQEEKRRTEEYNKLMEENKENEQRRRFAEQAEIQRKVAADRMQKQKSHPLYAMLVKELGEEAVEKMDLEQFVIEKRNLLDKERKEQQNKMLQQEKKFDYYVRAIHLEEMLVWKELSDEQQACASELFDQYEATRIDKEIKAREKMLEAFQLLTNVKDDAIKFMRSTIQSHAEDLKIINEKWKKKVELVREKAIEKLANERMKTWQSEVKLVEEEQRRKEEEQPPPKQICVVEAPPPQQEQSKEVVPQQKGKYLPPQMRKKPQEQ
ncbi:unnamed protein product [Meloidogyne enterolobii]|uniref:Uncharacterized protein n=1 Tax=Meloidogyne enterolobii TaxID=390850 RepID=A0ACB0Z451_MELEN